VQHDVVAGIDDITMLLLLLLLMLLLLMKPLSW
jgi:hypothetical protein